MGAYWRRYSQIRQPQSGRQSQGQPVGSGSCQYPFLSAKKAAPKDGRGLTIVSASNISSSKQTSKFVLSKFCPLRIRAPAFEPSRKLHRDELNFGQCLSLNLAADDAASLHPSPRPASASSYEHFRSSPLIWRLRAGPRLRPGRRELPQRNLCLWRMHPFGSDIDTAQDLFRSKALADQVVKNRGKLRRFMHLLVDAHVNRSSIGNRPMVPPRSLHVIAPSLIWSYENTTVAFGLYPFRCSGIEPQLAAPTEG